MLTIGFRTKEFATDTEGDLIRNNGQPGSAVAHWLRATLAEQGIQTGEPIQEDYGWGFWLDASFTIWVAVSFAGIDALDSEGEIDKNETVPRWVVSVSHERLFFSFRQWRLRQPAHELVQHVFKIIHMALSTREGIAVELE